MKKSCLLPFYTLMTMAMLAMSALAQTPSAVNVYPYECGFEDATENAGWQFVGDAANSSVKWAIGAPGKRNGTKGLFVTSDNGATASYTHDQASVVMAYREFILPAGDYVFNFDRRCKGQVDADFLSVCLVTNSSESMTHAAGQLPTWFNTYVKLDSLSMPQRWQSFNFSYNCSVQDTVRLVFIWRNDASVGNDPAVLIDNVNVYQMTPLDYYCDFEDSVENSKWLINNGTCVNRWTIGSAVYETPNHALYISPDTGRTASYNNATGFVTAVRELVLPPNVMCDISFDWLACGEKSLDYLSVCWVEDRTADVSSNNNSSAPPFVGTSAIQLHGSTQLSGQVLWRHAKFTKQGTGRPVRLVFFWINNSTITNQPGGAIDNIQITANACQAPENLTATSNDSGIVLNWTALPGATYEIRYRNTITDGPWQTVSPAVSGGHYVLQGLNKGRYDVHIRTLCDTLHSSVWSEVLNLLIVTDEGCINYTSIHDPSVATATYGTFSNPFQHIGVVDNGADFDAAGESSRHTVCTVPEFDPNTNYGLRTIPVNALATVRLGNWKTGSEAESIEYKYKVDSINSILLLQYAVVLENPGHEAAVKPRFKLEVFDNNNILVDPNCGKADFIPGNNTQDWHTLPNDVQWKDWTLMGLNLANLGLIGQNIKIRLTTYDCDWSGHYGYAYFMLNCAGGEVRGLSCGEALSDSIIAPDGFDYEWYHANNYPGGTPISTSQSLKPAPGDTSSYVCKIMLKDHHSCFFTQRVSLAPRWPVPVFTNTPTPQNCLNRMTFNNKSYMRDRAGANTGVEPDAFEWHFEGAVGRDTVSTAKNPVITYPNAGGVFWVTLVVKRGECDSMIRRQITVPPIDTAVTATTVSICRGKSYKWLHNGVTYTEETHLRDTVQAYGGCDSILTLDLTVVDNLRSEEHDTICESDLPFRWNGREYNASTVDSIRFDSQAGCDSMAVLNLTVNPILGVTVAQIGTICTDDDNFMLKYTSNGTTPPTNFRIEFSDAAKRAGFVDTAKIVQGGDVSITIPIPAKIRPGNYGGNMIFHDSVFNCGDRILAFNFDVNYRSSIVEQRWNDVLAVLNSGFNGNRKSDGGKPSVGDRTVGGYEFSAYQWYKNDLPIVDATKSYLYLTEGLDVQAKYRVLLTRADDGISAFTCFVTPNPLVHRDINVYPITPKPTAPVKVQAYTGGTLRVWNALGILVGTYSMPDGQLTIPAPSTTGIYVLELLLDDGQHQNVKIVVNK